jgi:hypothetical protein
MMWAQLLAWAMLLLWPGLAIADRLLSGEEAAYIDWGVNNCGVRSSDKEHAMVDKADAKDAGGLPAQVSEQRLERCTRFAGQSGGAVRRHQGLVRSLREPLRGPHQLGACVCGDLRTGVGSHGSPQGAEATKSMIS